MLASDDNRGSAQKTIATGIDFLQVLTSKKIKEEIIHDQHNVSLSDHKFVVAQSTKKVWLSKHLRSGINRMSEISGQRRVFRNEVMSWTDGVGNRGEYPAALVSGGDKHV